MVYISDRRPKSLTLTSMYLSPQVPTFKNRWSTMVLIFQVFRLSLVQFMRGLTTNLGIVLLHLVNGLMFAPFISINS